MRASGTKKDGISVAEIKRYRAKEINKEEERKKKNSPVITVKKPQQSYSRTGREEEKLSRCECREITVDSSESRQSGLAFDG